MEIVLLLHFLVLLSIAAHVTYKLLDLDVHTGLVLGLIPAVFSFGVFVTINIADLHNANQPKKACSLTSCPMEKPQ